MFSYKYMTDIFSWDMGTKMTLKVLLVRHTPDRVEGRRPAGFTVGSLKLNT